MMLNARTETEPGGVPRPIRSQRGSVLPAVMVLLMITTAFIIAVSRTGQALVDQARADATADVVALAAAGGDGVMAHEVAAANGASVVELTRRADGAVVVEISRRGRRSAAAAAVGQ